jgi:Protein of unknown function (DUF3866)
VVSEVIGGAGPEQELVVDLEGRSRRAIADVALVGAAEVGDELIVNTQALDLDLGSGGFDIVHVNLTRGLRAADAGEANVMKLNFTSLQHTVTTVDDQQVFLPLTRPAAVLALHGQLAAVAWAFDRAAPQSKLGFVQTEGGALPGGHSRTVRALRERGLLTGHLTAGAAFGGEAEAITLAGALHHGLQTLGWDAALCGPGPGIVGSGSPLGHGGMSALDSAHVALALGCPTLLVARMSSSDERARHRGISHHTLMILELLLEPVSVALPAAIPSLRGQEVDPDAIFTGLTAGAQLDAKGLRARGVGAPAPSAQSPRTARPGRIARHHWRRVEVDLAGYAASGLPTETMGRGLAEDPLFFAAALAGGTVLGGLAGAGEPHRRARGEGRDTSGSQEGAFVLEAKLEE